MNHYLNAFDIDSTGSNIGCYECDAISFGEASHRTISLALGEATVKSSHTQTRIFQFVTDSVDAPSCSAEDDAAAILADSL